MRDTDNKMWDEIETGTIDVEKFYNLNPFGFISIPMSSGLATPLIVPYIRDKIYNCMQASNYLMRRYQKKFDKLYFQKTGKHYINKGFK